MNMKTCGRHVALAQQIVSSIGKNRNVLKHIIAMSVMQIYARFQLHFWRVMKLKMLQNVTIVLLWFAVE